MAFEDYYNPNRDSVNAPNAANAGAKTGLAIGSMFGPAGAAIGAIAGGILGAFSGNGARDRARRKATDSSYAFGKELYNYGTESRTNITREFDQNESMLQARLASSGSNNPEMLAIERGKLLIDRDSKFKSLSGELETFRNGANYEWLRKDYERLTAFTKTRKGKQDDDNPTVYSIGSDAKGLTGKQAFTDEQYAKIQTYSTDNFGNGGGAKLYEDYAAKIAPTLEMYEQRVYGDKKAVAAYNAEMDSRIEKANVWYTAQSLAQRQQEKIAQELKFRNSSGDN